jgi:hypothetical protein
MEEYMAFLLVQFPEYRQVIIDDVDTGIGTGQIIEVEPGHHDVTLTPPSDFEPPVHIVVVQDNIALEPLEVRFEKK